MRAENWEDRVDGVDIGDEGGGRWKEGAKRRKQDGGIEEREGRRGAQKLHLAINRLKQLSVV